MFVSDFYLDRFLGILPSLRSLSKRRRYYAAVETKVASPRVQSIVETLKRDGMVVIPNFLSIETISTMLKNLPSDDQYEESVEGDKALFYLNAHALPGLESFFDDSIIRDIATAYISKDAIPLRQSIEWRRTTGQVIACDRMYHMDTWRHRLKAFLYLYDVGIDDAPMMYLRGSHVGTWRLPMEARIDRRYKTDVRGYAISPELAFLGCYWPYEVDELKQMHGLEEIMCTGSAGSLVLFDARGLHRATELRGAYRKLLVSYWIRKGHHT